MTNNNDDYTQDNQRPIDDTKSMAKGCIIGLGIMGAFALLFYIIYQLVK